MNEIRTYLNIINEGMPEEVYNYSFFFTGDYGDQNFYVKSPNEEKSTIRKAVKIASRMADGKYGGSDPLDDEYLEIFEINPVEHDFFEPYLYDEGT